MNLLTLFNSEILKTKRTATLYLCFIVAAIVPVIMFFDVNDDAKVFQQIALDKYFTMGQQVFNFIFLPLFIILISTLLLQIEYRNNTWKQVLTSPQKMINVFLSKFITLHFLIILFIITYLILLLAGFFTINLMQPKLFKGEFNLMNILRVNLNAYISIFALSAIQFWLSLRFKNFIAPLAIGFTFWFMAPLMLFSLNWQFANHYPYSFPILISEMQDLKVKPDVKLISTLTILYGVVVLSLAFVDFKIRKIRT